VTPLTFVLDQDSRLPACDGPWRSTLAAAGIDAALEQHQPDIAYVPGADYHQILRSGDQYYRVHSFFHDRDQLPHD
jgi:hypothetical protein